MTEACGSDPVLISTACMSFTMGRNGPGGYFPTNVRACRMDVRGTARLSLRRIAARAGGGLAPEPQLHESARAADAFLRGGPRALCDPSRGRGCRHPRRI